MRKVIFVIGLVLALSVSALAESNQMAYQGRLTDDVGAPLGPDTVTVVFEIFDDSTAAANSVWIDTLVVNTDAQGVFTAILDGVQPVLGAIRYVEMTVRGTTLAPRQPLTSAPYALSTPFGSAVKQASGGSGSITSTGYSKIASVTATFPSDGMVMIIGEAYFQTGTANFWLNARFLRDGSSIDFWYWDAGDTDTWYDQHQSRTMVTTVTAGTHTFDLEVSASSGSAGCGGQRMIVAFFPSALP